MFMVKNKNVPLDPNSEALCTPLTENIAKGTTDPRIEFISQIFIKFHTASLRERGKARKYEILALAPERGKICDVGWETD